MKPSTKTLQSYLISPLEKGGPGLLFNSKALVKTPLGIFLIEGVTKITGYYYYYLIHELYESAWENREKLKEDLKDFQELGTLKLPDYIKEISHHRWNEVPKYLDISITRALETLEPAIPCFRKGTHFRTCL
jgi:hypothetical protein